MEMLWQDLRCSFRMLARRPAFAGMAVLVLALGIGANTAIFSLTNSVLIRALPYPDAERLVEVSNSYPGADLPKTRVSIPDYLERRDRVEAFEDSSLLRTRSFNLATGDATEHVEGARVTASFFSVFGVDAALGRTFTADEEVPGQDKVVVLSFGLWQSRFGGDPAIVGGDLRLDGESARVVGVMPRSFAFPHPEIELWQPFAFTAKDRADDSRGREFSMMLARLRPGATVEMAEEQMDAIIAANKERLPEAREAWDANGFHSRADALHEVIYGDVSPVVLVLQAAMGLVLLIACANVANLMLTRLSARRRELVVRSSLGAGPWSVVRLVVLESLLLAVGGGVAGAALGYLGGNVIDGLGLETDAGPLTVALDGRVLLFTSVLALVTAAAASLFALASSHRLETSEVVRESASGVGPRGMLSRHSVVVVQIAAATTMLTGAGLMTRTMLALLDEDPGFVKDGVVAATVVLQGPEYEEEARINQFYDQALERIRALPGVASAGRISHPPFVGGSMARTYAIEGRTPRAGEEELHAFLRFADDDYFETLGIPLVRGRGFNAGDGAESQRVAVIDQRLVDKHFPDRDPIGQNLLFGSGRPYKVIGVVGSVKFRNLDDPITKETIYLSYRRFVVPDTTFVVRTRTDPDALIEPMRAAVREVDPHQPLFRMTVLDRKIESTLRDRHAATVLLLVFGSLAVVLAAVGVYGVLAFSTSLRRRELALRMALGAEPNRILRLVLRQAIVLALLGVTLGLAASLLSGRFLSALLFGVPAHDAATLGSAAALVVGVSLAACARPAQWAMRVDPAQALREE